MWQRRLRDVGYLYSRKTGEASVIPSGQFHQTSSIKQHILAHISNSVKLMSLILKIIKKRSERHRHCALAVARRSRKFSPRRRLPSRGAGRPKFNQLEMVTIPLPTNPVWWRSMHAISSYSGNRPRHTHTNKPTDRTDYNTLCHS